MGTKKNILWVYARQERTSQINRIPQVDFLTTGGFWVRFVIILEQTY